MNLDIFLKKLNETPENIEFTETMAVIESTYNYTETAFSNGDLKNASGENSGSCKLFSFAKLQKLDTKQTLACFGLYYRDEVLLQPNADNHQNIRNFMNTAWNGIKFDKQALVIKP